MFCFVLSNCITFTTLWIFLDKASIKPVSPEKAYLHELEQIQGHLWIWGESVNSQVFDLNSKCFTIPGDVVTFYSQTLLRTLDITLCSFYLSKLKPKK